MRTQLFVTLAALALLSVSGRADQAPAAIDTSKLGPQAGAVVPAFAGVDQFGKPQTLDHVPDDFGSGVRHHQAVWAAERHHGSEVALLRRAASRDVHAPGKHDYQVVRLTLDPQPWLRPQSTIYPVSEIYHFRPLDERVEVFMKPFRLRRDVTLLATPEGQKLLGALTSVTISGALEYQACDDKVCFNPTRVPISFVVSLKGLDRRPPG